MGHRSPCLECPYHWWLQPQMAPSPRLSHCSVSFAQSTPNLSPTCPIWKACFVRPLAKISCIEIKTRVRRWWTVLNIWFIFVWGWGWVRNWWNTKRFVKVEFLRNSWQLKLQIRKYPNPSFFSDFKIDSKFKLFFFFQERGLQNFLHDDVNFPLIPSILVLLSTILYLFYLFRNNIRIKMTFQRFLVSWVFCPRRPGNHVIFMNLSFSAFFPCWSFKSASNWGFVRTNNEGESSEERGTRVRGRE